MLFQNSPPSDLHNNICRCYCPFSLNFPTVPPPKLGPPWKKIIFLGYSLKGLSTEWILFNMKEIWSKFDHFFRLLQEKITRRVNLRLWLYLWYAPENSIFGNIHFWIGPKIALHTKDINQFVLYNALECQGNEYHLLKSRLEHSEPSSKNRCY